MSPSPSPGAKAQSPGFLDDNKLPTKSRGKAADETGQVQPPKAIAPPPLLACPYMKQSRYFNFRSMSSCSRGFSTFSEIMHVYLVPFLQNPWISQNQSRCPVLTPSLHSQHLRTSHNPFGTQHQFHAPGSRLRVLLNSKNDLDRLLADSEESDGEPSAWAALHRILFPEDDVPPPYNYYNTEYLALHRAQSRCIDTFSQHLPGVLGPIQMWQSSPEEWVFEALREFVQLTFRFCKLYGADSVESTLADGKSGSQNFATFLNNQIKQERIDKWNEFGPASQRIEREPNDTSLKPKTTIVKIDLTEKERENQSRASLMPRSRMRNPSSKPAAEALGRDAQASADRASTASSDVPPQWEKQAKSFEDSTGDSQSRDILDYCCRRILATDLDSIADSPLLYNTLVDLADDFVADLTEATRIKGNGNGSDSNASPDGGFSNPGPHRLPASFKSGRPGDRDDGVQDKSGGNSRQQLFKQTATSSKAKAISIRLPCPFRMKFPRTFNVRTHYSCSMTYFPTIGRLKDHLREHHKRQDGAEVLCPRCFTGFKSRDELHQHSKAEKICLPGEFDPTVGLHGEAVNLLRGRDKVGQDYVTQWRDICKIVFQSDQVVPSPEYRAVVEHFEFVETYFSSFQQQLVRIICPLDAPNQFVHLHDISKACDFGAQATNLFRTWYHLGLSTSSDPWSLEVEGFDPNDDQCKVFHGVITHCIHVLGHLDEMSRNMMYGNDSSRGNGGRSSTRRGENLPDRTPTSSASQVPSSSSTLHHSLTRFNPQNDTNQRPSKRRKIAPAPTLTPASPSIATPLTSNASLAERLDIDGMSTTQSWPAAGPTPLAQVLDGYEAVSHSTSDAAIFTDLPVDPLPEGDPESFEWHFEVGDMDGTQN